MSVASQIIKGIIPFTHYPYQGEELPCGICGSEQKTMLSEYDRRLKKLTTVICDNCGLLRTDPMPTEAELAEYYATSYRFDYQLAGSKPPKFHLNRSKRLADERFENLKGVLKPGSNILDFGTGSGEFLAKGIANGHTAVGIEPGEAYAKFAEQEYGVKVYCSAWETTDLGDQKFDLITAFHVFEHLRDPRAALQWLIKHLSPNGVIYLEVPDMMPRQNGRRLFEELHFAHVHGFTPPTLVNLGEVCGMEVEPRITPMGTGIGFRMAKKSAGAPNFDSAFSQSLTDRYDSSNIVAHIFKGRWILDAFKRLKKDVGETFAKK